MLDNLRATDKFVTLRVPTRVDSFNFADFQNRVESALEKNVPLVLDLSTTRFLSLTAIKLLEKTAEIQMDTHGEVILFGATEKLKQQIRVYASLKGMRLVSAYEWKDLVNTDEVGEA